MEGKSNLTALPASTIRLIGSTQVITSVYSVVKELIENSFDAESTVVDVKLDNYGLDKIEVKDNGLGIHVHDVPFVGQRHYTSKITTHSDLQNLHTYGFRGEALASLCSVAEVTVTTKTKEDDISICYSLTNEGKVKNSKPSHLGQGTTIGVVNLFKNLPVRKQYHNTVKKKKTELKKIEDILKAYSIIKPEVRITLRHNKEMIVQKTSLPDTKSAILNILGHSVSSLLELKEESDSDTQIKISGYLPKPGSDIMICSRSSNDRSIISVNNRYVTIPEIDKLVKQYYSNCHACDTSRYPMYYISINLPADKLDVNLDPNKSKVYLQDMDVCKKLTEKMLEYMYGPLDEQPYWKRQNEQKASDMVVEERNKEAQDHLIQFERQADKMIDQSNIEVSLNTTDDNDEPAITTDISSTSKTCQDLITSVDFDDTFEDAEELKITSACDTNKGNFTRINDKNVADNGPENSMENIQNYSDLDSLSDINKQDNTISNDISTIDRDVSTTNKQIKTSMSTNDCTLDITEPSLEVGMFDITDDLLDEILPTQTPTNPGQQFATNPGQQAPTNTDQQTPTHSGQQTSTRVEDIDDDKWIKGRGCSVTGKIIQPVTLLPPGLHHTPGKRPLSPSQNTAPPEKKPRPVMNRNIAIGQTTMYDIIENQPMKRPQTSFDLYMKDVRSQVVQDNPDALFDDVTQIIQDLWDNLPSEERRKYIHKASGNKPKPFTVVGKRKSEVTPISERLLSTMKKPKKYRPGLPVKDIPFSLSKLHNKYKTGFLHSQSQPDVNWNVIGCLKSSGMWACCHGYKLFLGNPHRMTEVVIHQRLMKDYCCSTQPLENPLRLDSRLVGGDNSWELLKTLASEERSHDQYITISNKHIVNNGFKLKCYTNKESEEFTCELIEIANYIPTYSIKDLSEILTLLSTYNNIQQLTLPQTRPLKVINYLKAEAVRMTRSKTALRTKDEIEDLIVNLTSMFNDGDKSRCLHDKDIFYKVYDLLDLPQDVQDESYLVTQS